jgi:DNA-binding NarL/FixJ family response regulator
MMSVLWGPFGGRFSRTAGAMRYSQAMKSARALERLSPREPEVLHRTVEGYSSVQIGLQLSLSPKTVDTYRSRLMQKLGVSNRSSLIRFAIQHAIAP